MTKILKKLVLLIAFIPTTAHSQYFGVTSSTTTGRASMTLVGQELLYQSTAATSASIILQGNGGRITANGITLKSSATVQGPLAVTGTVTAGGFSGQLSGNAATATALAAAGSTAGSGYVCRGVDAYGNCLPAVVDATVVSGSTNPAQSGAMYTALAGKQATGSYALSTGQAFTGNITAPNITATYGVGASTAIVTGNVSVGTTTAQTRLNVVGGDIRVQGDATGFGTVPTSGEGLEIAYDSANHYAWFGAYNRTTAAYTGNYIDGSTMGLNYYSKGPVIIGGNTSAPGLTLTYGVSAATGTFTSTATLAAASITGNLKFTGSTPSSGYLLTSDASGNASWTAPATGAVVLGASQTFTGANIFAGATTLSSATVTANQVYEGGYPVFMPQTLVKDDWVGVSTKTYVLNTSTGTYEITMRGYCNGSGRIDYRWNSDSGSNYYVSGWMVAYTGGNAAQYTNGGWGDGWLCFCDTSSFSCKSTINIGPSADNSVDILTQYIERSNVNGGTLQQQWLGATSYPKTISIYYQAGGSNTITAHVVIRKVSD